MLLEQCPPLPFGHATPHPELHPVVQGISTALGDHRAVPADDRGLALGGAPHEQFVRIGSAAASLCNPGDPCFSLCARHRSRNGRGEGPPGAVRLTDISELPFAQADPRPLSRVQIAYAIYATLRTLLLPVSHCVSKLGGQIAFWQQSGCDFFGTTVQSLSESLVSACHQHRHGASGPHRTSPIRHRSRVQLPLRCRTCRTAPRSPSP